MHESTNTKLVSILECISANGQILPLYIIFKAKIMIEAWIKELQKMAKYVQVIRDGLIITWS